MNTVVPPIGAACLLGILTLVAPDLRHMRFAPLICAAGFSILGGVSLLPTYALSILAGWTFGFWIGFATSLSGIVGASLVSYWIARHVSGTRLLEIIDERPNWRAIHFALLASNFWRAVWILFLVRNSPFPPFGLTNFVMGAAHVKFGRFFVGTLLGMTVHVAALVLVAVGMQKLSFETVEQPWLLVASGVALLAVVIVIGRLSKRALASAPPPRDDLPADAASHA